MKKLFVLFSILMSFQSAYAVSDAGFSDPKSAVDAFLKPLMNGPSGVAESMKALPGETATDNKLIAQAKKDMPVRPLAESMMKVVGTSGKLQYYRKTSEEIKLGGKMVKQFYDLFFTAGPKKELMIVVLQPTMSGGYHIMDAQITNAAQDASTTGN